MNQAIAQGAAVPAARIDVAKVALLALAFALAVISGYRLLGEGSDYDSYYLYYLSVTEYLETNVSRFEIGFEYWSWFAANTLYLPFQVFFTLTAFVALHVKFDLFRKYAYAPWFAILTYLALFYPVHEYTQIRAAVALAFSYFGIFKVYERKYVLAALSFAVALAFHASALVVVIIGVGAMLVPLHVTMIGFFVVAVSILLYGELVNSLIRQFFNFNNTIELIIDNPELYEVNLVSFTNVCLALATVLCVAGGAHRGKLGRTFLTMSMAAFVFMILFQASPILAQRVKEMLWLAILFLAYRPVNNPALFAARILLVLGGLWSVYRGAASGVLMG